VVKIRDDEIYPNQPLVDVACEVRFPGEMAVECELNKFWDRIREQYSDIFVPPAKEGQPVALQHYRFCTGEPRRTVSVALNSIAYSENQYRGHKLFMKEFLRVLAEFRKCFRAIDHVNRIGWRYVNVIPFMREEGLVPVKRLLHFDIKEPTALFDNVSNFDVRFESRVRGGTAIVHAQAIARKDQPQQEALLLDIDFGKEGPDLRMRDVSKHISQARQFSRRYFEALITDEYREYLRGTKL